MSTQKIDPACQDDSSVKMIKALLNQESTGLTGTPLTDEDKKIMREGLDQYLKDCTLCKQQAFNDYTCAKTAQSKLMNSLPFNRKRIYPQRNYEWSYANYVDNNYSPMSTGATKSGTISGLFSNLNAMIKLVDGYMFAANPSSNSTAGGTTKADDYAYYECTGGLTDQDGNVISSPMDAKICQINHQIKYGKEETAPTQSNFIKDQPLNGNFSSSYFVKAGTCPRPDIKSGGECRGKGYDWITSSSDENTKDTQGDCYQPRYAFVDNSAGLKIAGVKLGGLVPSIAKDFLELSPEKVIAAMEGNSINGSFIIEPCPIVEGYQSFKHSIDITKDKQEDKQREDKQREDKQREDKQKEDKQREDKQREDKIKQTNYYLLFTCLILLVLLKSISTF